MSAGSEEHPEPDPSAADSGVTDSVRAAVERTMRATAGSAASTRGRAAELVDERASGAAATPRDELARRGQEAGAELARRGQEATGEVGRRLEALERRLAELESSLAAERREPGAGGPRLTLKLRVR